MECTKVRTQFDHTRFDLLPLVIWSRSFWRSVKCNLRKEQRWSKSVWPPIVVALAWLRKQPTFGDATTGFPAKWRLRNERKNSILTTRHYPDLGSASNWLNQISHPARPNRSTGTGVRTTGSLKLIRTARLIICNAFPPPGGYSLV